MLRIGATYHVIAHMNRRELILNSQETKSMFLEVVRREKSRHSFSLKNFCIMGNHIHFMIEPAHDESLSRIMQWILSVFAAQYNRRFHLMGTSGMIGSRVIFFRIS
jgi:putative transposase